jgi:hypothetical protein
VSAGEGELRFVGFFPVEGDTAIAELMSGDELWGDLRLEGIDLAASGPARTANAVVQFRLFPPQDGRAYWDFAFDDAQRLLSRARAWLLENEHDRVPDRAEDS